MPKAKTTCEHCKWFNPKTAGYTGRCAILKIYITKDFFCAIAEKKPEKPIEGQITLTEVEART